MNDVELIRELGLRVEEVARMIGVRRQNLHRALASKPERGHLGVARTRADGQSVGGSHYLNTDRLLAIWVRLLDQGEHAKANRLRQEIVARHPGLARMIAPYEQDPPDPDTLTFSEAWVFSNEPLELVSSPFRRKMRIPLQDPTKRLVYFLPSEELAGKLLKVLDVVSNGELHEVFLVVTPAVMLATHWIVVFVGDDHNEILAGVFPESSAGWDIWRRLATVPRREVQHAIDTLMQADLLDARDRFRLPPTAGTGNTTTLPFKVFYPEAQ